MLLSRRSRRNNEGNLARADNQRQDPSKQVMSREEAVARFKAHERIRLKERRRLEEYLSFHYDFMY